MNWAGKGPWCGYPDAVGAWGEIGKRKGIACGGTQLRVGARPRMQPEGDIG